MKIGTCSLCGGDVVIPQVKTVDERPCPTCNKCGATCIGGRGDVLIMMHLKMSFASMDNTGQNPDQYRTVAICEATQQTK